MWKPLKWRLTNSSTAIIAVQSCFELWLSRANTFPWLSLASGKVGVEHGPHLSITQLQRMWVPRSSASGEAKSHGTSRAGRVKPMNRVFLEIRGIREPSPNKNLSFSRSASIATTPRFGTVGVRRKLLGWAAK